MGQKNNAAEISGVIKDVGFIILSRKIMDHPFFSEKPFSKFHALAWLLLTARYSSKPVTRLIGGHMVTWSRGQLPGSLRYLAEAFGWSTKKVSNWLSFLEKQKTIKLLRDDVTRASTIIELINYETYQKWKHQEKHPSANGNELPQRVLAGSACTDGNTNGNTEETPGKHRGNKTVKKEENNEKESVCVNENTNSHTQGFLKNMNKGEYSEREKEQIIIVRGMISKYAPVLSELKKPLTDKECLIFSEKFNQEIAVHIFKAIDDKVTPEKHLSAARTIDTFLKNERNPEIKASIKLCQLIYENNKSSSPQSKSTPETLEEKGRRLIDEVINTPYVRPAMKTEAKEVAAPRPSPKKGMYADSG